MSQEDKECEGCKAQVESMKAELIYLYKQNKQLEDYIVELEHVLDCHNDNNLGYYR